MAKKIWYKGKKARMVAGIWFYPGKATVVSDELYDKLVNKDDWVSKDPNPKKGKKE